LQDRLIHRKIGESKTAVKWDSNMPLNLTIFQTVVVVDIMGCGECIVVMGCGACIIVMGCGACIVVMGCGGVL